MPKSMDPFILKWKATFAEYIPALAWPVFAAIAANLLLLFTPLAGLLGKGFWIPVALGAAALAAVLYLNLLRRLEAERLFSLNEDEITYQKFKNDVHTMRWNEIEAVDYSVPQVVRGGPGTPVMTFRSSNQMFEAELLPEVRDNTILVSLVRRKAKDKFKSDYHADSGPGPSKPQPALIVAQLLHSWGDLEEAEDTLRKVLGHVPVFDKQNLNVYLDEYATVLRQLGRTTEAAEIESRLPERIEQLCKRRGIFDKSEEW